MELNAVYPLNSENCCSLFINRGKIHNTRREVNRAIERLETLPLSNRSLLRGSWDAAARSPRRGQDTW